MPYQWVRTGASQVPAASPERAAPVALLQAWPHRSLSLEGFVRFIGATAALTALPLIGMLGTPALWGILPFAVLTVAGVWWAIRSNAGGARLTEELTLWRDRIELVRIEPRGRLRNWSADPYWVRVELHECGGPVEKYLTLKGGGREVELGAFLSPEERVRLKGELLDALSRVR